MSTAARLDRFHGHFAAAYGTLWLVILFAALVSRSNISTGKFGLFGFPVIALLYAVLRDRVTPSRSDSTAELAAPSRTSKAGAPWLPGCGTTRRRGAGVSRDVALARNQRQA